MKKLLFICVFINATVLYGQNVSAQLFEPTLIKADVDTLISKMKAYHPTFLDYYQDNKIQTKIDSIKKMIRENKEQ